VTSLREARFRTTIRQQYDFSCGSAAVATLLTFQYGFPVNEETVFANMYVNGDQAKIRSEGFSLLDMKRFLESRGFLADGYELPLSKLEEAQIPAIVLIVENGYHHFVVIKGIKGDRVLIGDPRAAPAPSSAITSKRSGTASCCSLSTIARTARDSTWQPTGAWRRRALTGWEFRETVCSSPSCQSMAPPISELRNIMVQTTISSASRCTAGRQPRPCCCAGWPARAMPTPVSRPWHPSQPIPRAWRLRSPSTCLQCRRRHSCRRYPKIQHCGGACRRPHRCGHVAENVSGELSSRSPKRLRGSRTGGQGVRCAASPHRGPLAAAMTMATRDPGAQVAEARDGMAKWKPVAQARLEESRGGFDVAGLQVGFGIDRAVFVNGALAVATSITIPDISSITSAQAAQLAQALAPVTVAVTAPTALRARRLLPRRPQRARPVRRDNPRPRQRMARQPARKALPVSRRPLPLQPQAAGSPRQRAPPAWRRQAVAAAAGTVVTNGLLTVIQNGAANTANVGAVSNMPATVIQNTLNNQNIQSLMTLNASVNTLAAFRAQMANTALNSVIPTMAGMK
jgi:hypothetical protein